MSTEKRLFLFLVLTFMVLAGYSVLMEQFGPKRPQPPVAGADKDKADKNKADKDKAGQDKKDSGKDKAAAGSDADQEKKQSDKASDADGSKQDEPADKSETADKKKEKGSETDAPSDDPGGPQAEADADKRIPHRVITLGQYKPAAGASPLLVTLNSFGAALERIELVGRTDKGSLHYRDLDDTTGYWGSLSLDPVRGGGCRVQVVPPGTPAAAAKPNQPGVQPGLRPGDVILKVNGEAVASQQQIDLLFKTKDLKPKDTATVSVRREVNQQPQDLTFDITLDFRPFQLVQPEPLFPDETENHPSPLLISIRGESQSASEFLDRLNYVDWEMDELSDPPGAEFRYRLGAAAARAFGLSGGVEVVKRYRLGSPTPAASDADNKIPAYHLDFEIELRNLGNDPQSLQYRLQGLSGLPTEGWWYLTKLHPRWFNSAGARDVALLTGDGYRLIGASALLSRMRKDEKIPRTPLFSQDEPLESRSVRFIGVDTQYFAAALLPVGIDANSAGEFSRAEAYVHDEIDEVPKGWERTANSTFQLASTPIQLDSDRPYVQKFRLFAGPKAPEVLTSYGLDSLIYYGWPIFGMVAKVLAGILHFFYGLVGNYGISIVLLTVLVRSCMFPISRTAARNAAMMQELAPEMRKIAEKHKNNFEARSKAQQELFRAHNYNPLGGCWLMFLQFPVFIGLYRCLAIDIELRQAPLIPGVEWCSNLAGPDKLFYWKTDFLSYFTDESGWLGPYFNLLPIFTIVLFLLHQKLFTPPATDEQTEMQMKMMKFMTIFMGILFYKVPAGLCLYFITSSLWGIAERKLIPKPTPRKRDDGGMGPGGGFGGGGFGGGGSSGGKGTDGGGRFGLSSLLKSRNAPEDDGLDRKKELERRRRKK